MFSEPPFPVKCDLENQECDAFMRRSAIDKDIALHIFNCFSEGIGQLTEHLRLGLFNHL